MKDIELLCESDHELAFQANINAWYAPWQGKIVFEKKSRWIGKEDQLLVYQTPDGEWSFARLASGAWGEMFYLGSMLHEAVLRGVRDLSLKRGHYFMEK